MKHLRLTLSSILSIVILISLTAFFSLAFAGVLLIYFVIRLYKKIKPSKKKTVEEKKDGQSYIDIDKDDYKID